MQASWWTDPKELDEDQRKVVSLADGNHLVVGPPGSGKTNLLLLRATYLHKKGITNTAVLTFGRVLNEFLATGVAHYPFARDKIQTYNGWGARLLRENGIPFDQDGPFPKVRARLLTKLSRLASQAKQENVLDCLLLDEAQDYSAEEIEIISHFADTIFAVGDEGQKITDKRGALAKLEQLGAQRSVLRSHYRNGIAICRVADGIRNLIDSQAGMEATSNYDEGKFPSSAEDYSGLDVAGQVGEAVSQIATQLQAYPDEFIGVLCPRTMDLDEVADELGNSTIAGSVQVQRPGAYAPLNMATPVVVTSIHGAKGLEFRAVHLMAADELRRFTSNGRNLAYTGVTRAKTALSVYHDRDLPGWFEKGMNACEIEPKSNPELDDLFL